MIEELYLGDCIQYMRTLKSESVDLCVTDPPYKLTSGGCKGGLKIEMNTITQKQKESGVMFEIPPFYRWMDELFRIMKNKTHFYCMSNQKNLKQMIIDGEKVGFKVLNILVWDKGMHTPLPYYMQNVEFVILFRKGNALKINNMGSQALISIKGIRGNKKHPSEKPIGLFKHFIENSSKEGDLVIDPFMGSGTGYFSAKETKRRFTGCEISEFHFNRIIDYKSKERDKLTLFK